MPKKRQPHGAAIRQPRANKVAEHTATCEQMDKAGFLNGSSIGKFTWERGSNPTQKGFATGECPQLSGFDTTPYEIIGAELGEFTCVVRFGCDGLSLMPV